MTARKIRMTAVGLVAMPVDHPERYTTADDLARDGALCTAWAELCERAGEAVNQAWRSAYEAIPRGGLSARAEDLIGAAERIEKAWNDAQTAACDNDADRLRAALQRAHDAASTAGYSTEHEDAALAMLPQAGRRAA